MGLATVMGCGSLNPDVKTESLGNGEFHLQCKGPLANCLEEADRLCMGSRYEVRSARDDRDYFGPATVAETEVRTSEAVIGCGQRGRNFFARPRGGGAGGGPPPAAPVLPAPSTSDLRPASAATTRACIPGATQLCVGPAACRGGQICIADGSAFGSCDCGGRASEPAPSPALPTEPPN